MFATDRSKSAMICIDGRGSRSCVIMPFNSLVTLVCVFETAVAFGTYQDGWRP
jgi:hypothetical protein